MRFINKVSVDEPIIRSRSHFTLRALVNDVFRAVWSICVKPMNTKTSTTSTVPQVEKCKLMNVISSSIGPPTNLLHDTEEAILIYSKRSSTKNYRPQLLLWELKQMRFSDKIHSLSSSWGSLDTIMKRETTPCKCPLLFIIRTNEPLWNSLHILSVLLSVPNSLSL